MKKYIQILGIGALMMGSPSPAKADVKDGTKLEAAFIAPLMAWVERATGVRVPVLPKVLASRERFDAIASRRGSLAGRPQSVYIPGTVILDSDRWDPEDPVQVSLLVHELVHHAQLFMKNGNWACRDAREGQAYTLQNHWLETQGRRPFVNAAWIQRVSACPDRPEIISLAQEPAE